MSAGDVLIDAATDPFRAVVDYAVAYAFALVALADTKQITLAAAGDLLRTMATEADSVTPA